MSQSISAPAGDTVALQPDATGCNIGQNRLNSLNEQQLVAIEMLANGKSVAEVAAALGVDRTTLWRWRKHVEFKEALDERAREVWLTASERLRSMIAPALDVMADQLADRFQPTRFRAAATILRLANLSKHARAE